MTESANCYQKLEYNKLGTMLCTYIRCIQLSTKYGETLKLQ